MGFLTNVQHVGLLVYIVAIGVVAVLLTSAAAALNAVSWEVPKGVLYLLLTLIFFFYVIVYFV